MSDQNMHLLQTPITFLLVTGLMASGGLLSLPAHAEDDAVPVAAGHTIVKLLRGKTVCTDSSPNSQSCGSDHWTVYVHSDGSRAMHVTSETARNGEVRHALIIVDADGTPHEAFMHNRSETGALGSTFVVLKEFTAETAINDVGLGAPEHGIDRADIETPEPAHSLSTGPASADGLHFLRYDFVKAGEQSRNVYWMGGSRQGSMLGSFRPTSHTYLGEATLTLPNGEDVRVDHFRMLSGTEAWLTKEDRMVVRMDLKFGNISGSRYDLIEYDIIEFGS
jgi:hypothetical protein